MRLLTAYPGMLTMSMGKSRPDAIFLLYVARVQSWASDLRSWGFRRKTTKRYKMPGYRAFNPKNRNTNKFVSGASSSGSPT